MFDLLIVLFMQNVYCAYGFYLFIYFLLCVFICLFRCADLFIIKLHHFSKGCDRVFSVVLNVPVILHQQSQTPVIPRSLSHTGKHQQQELQQTTWKDQTDPVYTVTMCMSKKKNKQLQHIISWTHPTYWQF